MFDASNNTAESFNSVVAKFIGGKRINFCLRNSYQIRCNAAALSYNTRIPNSKLHRTMYDCSPGRFNEKFHTRRIAVREAREKHRKKGQRKRLFVSAAQGSSKSYGVFAQKPDLDTNSFEEKKNNFS